VKDEMVVVRVVVAETWWLFDHSILVEYFAFDLEE